MDGNAGIDCHKTEDIVTLNRVAALGKFIDNVIYTLIDNKCVGRCLLCRLLTLLAGALCCRLRSTALLVCLATEPTADNLFNRCKVNLLGSNKLV